MHSSLDFEISGAGAVLKEVQQHGFNSFLKFAEFIRQLPYGRPTYANDILVPVKEGRGTCSSKHRLLAVVAHECGCPEIKLIVGLYEMSDQNTPGVGAVLAQKELDSVPEAHCYLQLDNQRYDFTGLDSGISSPFETLLQESIVSPKHLYEVKLALHQKAMRAWAESHALSFEDAWEVREACIRALEIRKTVKPTASSAGLTLGTV